VAFLGTQSSSWPPECPERANGFKLLFIILLNHVNHVRHYKTKFAKKEKNVEKEKE